MSQVVQTNRNYKIKTQTSGTITLDTSPIQGAPGTVVITGDLVVQGEQTTVNVSEMFVEDNIIRLNVGEQANGITKVYSGLEVDRGFISGSERNLYATLWYNESDRTWEITDQNSLPGGNLIKSFNDSSLKLRSIITDQLTDSGDLTLIGQGTGVVKVSGTENYEQQVTNDDDIPNKKYVDQGILNRLPNNRIQRADTFVQVQDTEGGAIARALMEIFISSVNNGGFDYQSGETLYLVGGDPADVATFTVDTVDQDGKILTLNTVNSGAYIELPPSNTNVSLIGGSGSGATVNIISWSIKDIEILSGGNDYVTATVSFNPAGATGDVVVDSDSNSDTFKQILDVTINNPGLYQVVPTVSFASGLNPTLTESQATVVVDGDITSIFYNDRVKIQDLVVTLNEISPFTGYDDIVLKPTTLGYVEINEAVNFKNRVSVPGFIADSTVLYTSDPSVGETGLYFNNEKQSLLWSQWVTNNSNFDAGDLTNYPVKNEFISKSKALVMSMLF